MILQYEVWISKRSCLERTMDAGEFHRMSGHASVTRAAAEAKYFYDLGFRAEIRDTAKKGSTP